MRIATLADRLNCALSVLRCWKSDGGVSRMYCNFRGVLHRSPEILIEVAGTICADLTDELGDEINMFVFINGRRLGVLDDQIDTRKYLIGHGKASFRWDYNDCGFDQFTHLNAETFLNPIDESLAMNPTRDDEHSHKG